MTDKINKELQAYRRLMGFIDTDFNELPEIEQHYEHIDDDLAAEREAVPA